MDHHRTINIETKQINILISFIAKHGIRQLTRKGGETRKQLEWVELVTARNLNEIKFQCFPAITKPPIPIGFGESSAPISDQTNDLFVRGNGLCFVVEDERVDLIFIE